MRVEGTGFELTADEPVSVGGAGTGPMPTQLFLSSLGTCFAMAVAFVAHKRGVELPDLDSKGKDTVTDAVVRGEKPLFEKQPSPDKESA